MRKRITNRRCVLCDTLIPDVHITCGDHWNDYLQYQNEEWMIELVTMQRRQFEIDKVEREGLNDLPTGQTKIRYRLTPDDKQQIVYYHEKGLGVKSIGKILGVKYHTIATYLYKIGKAPRKHSLPST